MKAIITGASSGIGYDMAKVLSEMGYELVLVARRLDKLEKLKSEIKTDALLLQLDLSKEASCYELYNICKNKDIDIIINNAGFGVYGGFTETDLSEELNMIDLNIKSVHILTKLFLSDFKKRNFGYILNVASIAAFFPGPLFAGYYASKAYVLRLTEAINEELKTDNVNVYVGALCPGPVRTEFDVVAKIRAGVRGLESTFVAKYAIKKMFDKKMIIIPGIAMKFSKIFSKFAPERLILKSIYMAQKNKK